MRYSDVIYSLYKYVHDTVEVPHSLHVNYSNTLDENVLSGTVNEAVYVFMLDLPSQYQTANPGANVRFGVYTSVAHDPSHRRAYQIVDTIKSSIGNITDIPYLDFSNVNSAADTPIDTGKTIPFVWYAIVPVALTNQMTCNIMYIDYRLFASELCLDMDVATPVTQAIQEIAKGIGDNKQI